MHPAPSVIIFSVLSGAGLGYLAFLGFDAPLGLEGFIKFFIGYALAVSGLLAALFHLGNKANAIKAFREWRTSWLSREAWTSVSALLLMGLFAFMLIFMRIRLPVLGELAAILCLATVFCTGMIYQQLRTIARWHQKLTTALFIAYALSAGAWLSGLGFAWALLLLTGAIQLAHWYNGDRLGLGKSNMNSATGLKGRIRAFAPPHTSPNYLLKEMAYKVGRKHSQKLRIIALITGFIFPSLLALAFGMGAIVIPLGFMSHLLGALAARWLFFAEARHSVTLYYG